MSSSISRLVLSRKPGDAFRLTVPPSSEPQEIVIKVLRWSETTCKIGIDAQRCVKVLRDELVDYEPAHPEGDSYA